MSRHLAVVDGSILFLSPYVVSHRTDVCVFVSDGETELFLETDREGCISLDDAQRVVAGRLGHVEAHDLFGRVELAEAIFGWDCTTEVDGLDRQFAALRAARGVDLGCGYGRLLMKLRERGYVLDGIDGNIHAVRRLAARLGRQSGCRAFRADIRDYVAPGAYAFAYSAMNTLRYLETKWGIRRHLQSVHASLEHDGLYLFSVSLTPQPWAPHQARWSVPWDGSHLDVQWQREAYRYDTDQIIDRVEVTDRESGAMVHRERQLQANLSWASIAELIEPLFRVEAVFDPSFLPIVPHDDRRGAVWIKLRKRTDASGGEDEDHPPTRL